MRSEAVKLAARGLRVFPLRPNSKRPLRRGWQDDATADAFEVLENWPDSANVGIACGDDITIIDVDVEKGGIEAIPALQLPRTFTVRTRSGGFHYYFRTPPGQTFANSVGWLAPGVDVRGRGGLAVGSGSVIDRGRYEIATDAPIAELPPHIAERLKRAPERSADAGKAIVALDLPVNVERARRYLAQEAPIAIEGQHGDDTTYRVCCRLGDFGISPLLAFDLLAELWNERCAPPWDADDLERKIASSYRSRQDPVGRDSPTRTLVTVPPPPGDPDALLEFPRQVDVADIINDQSRALVKGILQPSDTAFLYGASGSGKTFLALDLGWHLAHGRAWHGRKVERAPVLYVALEGVRGFRKRVAAMVQEWSDPGDWFARLAVHVSLIRDEYGKQGAETVISAAKALGEKCGRPVGLIVIDTLARAMAGEKENDGEAAMGFVEHRAGAIIRETGAALLTVAHTNRGGDLRGSLHFRNASEVLLRAERDDKKRTLFAEKVKDDIEGPLWDYDLRQVVLGIDADDWPVSSCVIQVLPGAERREACRELTVRLMRDAIAGGDNLSPSPHAANYAPKRLADIQGDAGFSKDDFEYALMKIQDVLFATEEYGAGGRKARRFVIKNFD